MTRSVSEKDTGPAKKTGRLASAFAGRDKRKGLRSAFFDPFFLLLFMNNGPKPVV